MNPKRSKKYLILLLAILLFSCDKSRVFDEYKKLDGVWKKNDKVEFIFESNDSIHPYNLFFNIRNNKEYPFNNLYLIVTLVQPDQKIKTDTLEYLMAEPDGTLLGTGFSDIKESKLWYLEDFIFKQKGSYKIKIEHALRETGKIDGVQELKGITEVGFRVERQNEKK